MWLLTFNLKAQDSYTISECLTDCRIVSEVISDTIINNNLNLTIGVHLNCSVNPYSKLWYDLEGDTLNILIDEHEVHYDTLVTYNDSVKEVTIQEIRSMTSCRCFYKVSLFIENIEIEPGLILINGATLEDNYETRTIIELEE